MKLEEQILLEFRMKLEELITEREGMVAENEQRKILGNSMAYQDDSFAIVTQKIMLLRRKLVLLGEK